MGTAADMAAALLLVAVLLHCTGTAMVRASHAVYPELQSLEAEKVDETSRTGYHFQPPKHWINDPNGPMYYKGLYHLFYQYNPKGAVWGNIVWAHSVSTDLIDWTALDPGIYPSKKFDIKGCWSGSATVLPSGVPVVMYTGIDPDEHQVQNVAYPKNLSDPFLREWVKPDYNPIIAPDNGINASAFRDPTTAWYGPDRHWRLLVGSKVDDKGLAVLYRSRDFKRWVKAHHPLHSGLTGMWECPDFFPVAVHGGSRRHHRRGVDTAELHDRALAEEVKYVLKVSLDLTRYEYYTVGTYDHATDQYTPDAGFRDNDYGLRYDYGDFYASKSFYDPVKRRRILWGWANESDTVPDDRRKGWAGIQAIPRKLWLSPRGKQLIQWPVEEVKALRAKHVNVSDKVVKGGQYFEVTGFKSVQSDVEVSFAIDDLSKAEQFNPKWLTDPQALCKKRGARETGEVGPFGLWVLAAGDLTERTAVFFRVFRTNSNGSRLVVLMCNDPTNSTFEAQVYRPTFASFVNVDIAKTKAIALRTLIDHSVVESFGAGGRTCILTRVYPKKALGDNAHLFVFNHGEVDVKVTKLEAWEMKTPKMNAPAQ
ncbi:beta-fructofuranosidase, insoluble isoenzyme 3-like [Miscanthus floridulus]|uniref:beta-fructofuranosidase, insoluble isoenzyme 3-like n=1 Tax=Miscanthus floridulus TaxID=154761 RepID=UPI00345A8F60